MPGRTAISITSGQGNISLFDQIVQGHLDKTLPRPIDFINLQSNSAGFYVATHLGLNGKNLFLTHQHFPVQMALLAAHNDIRTGKQSAVLIGGVDEWFAKQELARKILGVDAGTSLGEGSNWMLINDDERNALGTLEIFPELLDKNQLNQLLSTVGMGTSLAFSKHFSPDETAALMNIHAGGKRYCYEDSCGYYETLPLYVLNRFLTQEKGRLLHIDRHKEFYRVMQINNNDFATGGKQGYILKDVQLMCKYTIREVD